MLLMILYKVRDPCLRPSLRKIREGLMELVRWLVHQGLLPTRWKPAFTSPGRTENPV